MSDSELRRRVRDSQQAGPSNGPADEPPPDQPWIGQQLVNSAKEFAQGAWEALLASAPVQAFWRLAAVQYAYGLVQLVLAVFLQVRMNHAPGSLCSCNAFCCSCDVPLACRQPSMIVHFSCWATEITCTFVRVTHAAKVLLPRDACPSALGQHPAERSAATFDLCAFVCLVVCRKLG